jgi:Spy/CpxP family protein refolding chaperone
MKRVLPCLTLALTLVVISIPPAFADNSQSYKQSEGNNSSLTTQQQQQIKSIRRSAMAQVMDVLTPAQQSQVQSQFIDQQRDKSSLRQIMGTLNLTNDQKSEIMSIMKASRAQIQSIKNSSQYNNR